MTNDKKSIMKIRTLLCALLFVSKAFAADTTVVTSPDGKTRFLQQSGKLITDSFDEMVMIGTIVDITEQKITERKLLKVKSFLNLQQFNSEYVEGMARTGSWIMDMDSGEMMWSRGIPELLGFKRGIQITQRSLLGVIHPDDKNVFSEKINSVQGGGAEEKFTIRITIKNETRYLLAHMQMVNFDDKPFFISTFQDKTTDRKSTRLNSSH